MFEFENARGKDRRPREGELSADANGSATNQTAAAETENQGLDAATRDSGSPISSEEQRSIGLPSQPSVTSVDAPETRFLKWAFFGKDGIRVGWSIAMFLALTLFFAVILGSIAAVVAEKYFQVRLGTNSLSATANLFQELVQFLSLLSAATVCALIEKRRVLDYNLSGPHRLRHFFTGTAAGIVALSLLIALLDLGGWIRFDSTVNAGVIILGFAVLWGAGFLLTGFSEEGMTRCYMLFTLARGINFWWALGTVGTLSLFAFLNPHSNGSLGVYIVASLGIFPCLALELKRAASAGFWQAAWVTTTFFGYFHTFNQGESWLGIFSAAAIGFVFCVSVWVTGSAWWAIGYHAAWDWAQTFFYGTPDSGFPAKGHFLTTSPAGDKLWSGGPDGPEGSLLVLVIIVVTLIYLVAVHGRKRVQTTKTPFDAAQPRLS